MQSRYIKNVEIPSYDEKINAVMKAKEFDDGEYNMVIAVENKAGKVYRLFFTQGFNEYMRAVDKMLDLGMTDKLADLQTSREGYDSRFHF